jgi:Zn-dependent peptidase ImmA (M78 family)
MIKPYVYGKTAKISRVFSKITRRLPSTYPKTLLVIHSSLKKLQSYFLETGGTALDPGDPGHPPFAYCDGEDNSIHVASVLNRDSARQISWYLLHEIGHLRALQKYGEEDSRWDDYKQAEHYANRFANKWCNRLKKEGFFKKT